MLMCYFAPIPDPQKGFSVSRISFQNEQPSDLDVFPGGSHDKVATAMCDYIADEKNSRVIGLDGEFGSGKSSILTMLQPKLVKVDQKYKVWFFDCEQNYQGSIKSNFIELFTDELIDKVGSEEKVRNSLQDSRDRALGRQFTYTKNTVSRVSSWALILVVALFFSTSSFKELFSITKMKDPVISWIFVHILSFVSPLIVLLIAHRKLKDTKVGDQPWSIFHLFKGGSDDTITEKIKVAKEVTPLDLKRTLEDDLKLIGDLHYVVILDNLDRLPKDSLRAVWSDLEIFTWVSADNNLTVIVPFCSNKVAKYLSPDHERTYDSRDFIAKKFPVVFRAPPIIAAGWKDGFYLLWQNTYPDAQRDIAEKCALLLQRHSPMRSKLVTPRLQKRFINDIATTSLTLGADIDIVCIGAHLLLCKYDELPLEEVIRTEGLSQSYKDVHPKFDDTDLIATKKLLDRHVGSGLERGWQIQFLQIHFLTNRTIAMAELIDEPLALAIKENNGERFADLVSTFGFNDAFKRYLSGEVFNADLLRVLAGASEKLSQGDFEGVISLLNGEGKTFQGDIPQEDEEFFGALKICRLAGMRTGGMEWLKSELAKAVRLDVNDAVQPDTLETKRSRLKDYDNFIDALGDEPITVNVTNASYYIHIFSECEGLKIVDAANFKFAQSGIKSIHQHIVALPDSTKVLPITESQREVLLGILNASVKFGQDPKFPMAEDELLAMSQSFSTYPNHEAILFGLAMSGKLPETVITQVISQPFEGRTASQNAAVAALLMSTKRFEELAQVEALESVVESDVFKLLFRGVAYSDVLISAYQDPTVGKIVSKVLAWAIRDNAVWRFNPGYVGQNFSRVANAVSPYGVEVQELFDWLNDWQRHFKAEFDVIDELESVFVERVVNSSESQFQDFKKGVLEFYGSDERSDEEWEPILLSESDNHCSLIQWAFPHQGFALGSGYRSSAIDVLRKIVVGELDDDATTHAVRSINTLLASCDQAQKNLLGTELRNIAYVENGIAEPAVWLLKNFGHLIVDIQPANTAEVGKLMGILEYLNEHSGETGDVLEYLEDRARQIASFNYSEQLREAMAVAVAKLKKSAPKLYQAFAKKSIFKRIFKDILNSEKKAEQAKTELLQAEQKKARETKVEQETEESASP
ncbi:KAP NTPase domain-containing protein [Pseudomonas sp. IT-P4]